MNRILHAATAVLLLSLGACSLLQPRSDALTFVVVRHAEKATDDPKDPALTDAGRARAASLATALADVPLVAVYATAFRRTQQTAAPAAAAHQLPVLAYDAAQPAAEFARYLRATHRSGQILVVGHSNTAPAIAAALCQCEVAPMDEAEYDRRMTVNIAPDGTVTLITAAVR